LTKIRGRKVLEETNSIHSNVAEVHFSKETDMISRATMIGCTDPAGSETAVEETERLAHSTHEHQIRNRAYEIYLQRGGQSGYELKDWLQAERELTK
jgi:hypothetical protein